ncbi:MAG: ABC transporter permease [Cyclobacteriaceae bacterium]
MIFIKLTAESIKFALASMRSNVFRTLLSLLGVTFGIFAIIAVLTLVDSLERSIKSSFSFLGANNLSIDKWPYLPENGVYRWWDFLNRPEPTLEEYDLIKDKVENARSSTIMTIREGVTIKHNSNSIGGNNLLGVAYTHSEVYDMPVKSGRYFSLTEANNGRNVAIIGHDIEEALFPNGNPEGKIIKIKGLKYVVIGVLEEEGESFIGTPSNDENCFIPYKSFQKLYYTGARGGVGSSITFKGFEEDKNQANLESEVRGLMRKIRGLKPKEEDNFAINRPEAIANEISSVFAVVSIAGWVIGGFSILVGGFGIANIMFVSVRERIPIIGIQKSLGAKNYFILFQFLFEAILLSAIGGGIGVFFVYLISFASLGSMEIILTMQNILIGLTLACGIGVIAGIVPAIKAARQNPVEAIRSTG